jgi:dipeptidyl aminopeptidase/acylaminoacyl peptidase
MRIRRAAFSLSIAAAILACIVTTPPGAADEGDGASGVPPLIDRDVFFGDPAISGAQISPDGKWISFRKPYNDVMNIWVKKTKQPFDAAHAITADTERPVLGYFWTQDSRYVLYVQDKGGDENYHVYAVDPAAKADAKTGVPPARDLTPIDGIRAAIYAVPEATPNRIIIGLNDRDPAMHDVYSLDIDTGERKLLIENDTNVAEWVTDLQGAVRLAYRQTDDGGSEMLPVVDGALGAAIYTCNFEETCAPYRFHKNGKQVYILSNKGEGVDLMRLMLMDAANGTAELVEADPDGEVDFGVAIFSDQTEELIATAYIGDRQRIYPKTDDLKKDLEFLRAKLPDGDIDVAAATEDERYWVVAVGSDVNPGQVFLYDRKKSKVEKLYDSRPELPAEQLAAMKAVRYPARDGVEIPAYLTLPKGVTGKLPAIVLPHGGPWARDTWGYDAFAQFLANRGYAVLQPNFRGSTGYGKTFLNTGNGEWGTGIMQNDLTDAVKYLVAQAGVDPERVAIMGGSYGGYATLAGVTFTPDLYAAGVSIVGPSNLITLLESIPPYWGPIEKIFHVRVGDPDVPEDRRRLEAQSPFYHADRIETPLLVIQGANDPRVKKAESDMIVVALRDNARPVEYLVAPDEGHGFAGEENRLAMFAVIEEFLGRHLGGRHQEGATPPVEERIAALRVDVDTVTMPVVPAGYEIAKTAPLPVPNVGMMVARTLSYVSEVKLGSGEDMTIESTRQVTADTLDDAAVWRIEDSASTPYGAVKDVFYLDAESLEPLKRTVSQGIVNVSLTFGETAITGIMKLPGRDVPVDVKLDAPVVGSDAALEAMLCSLPLAPGYTATLRTFDVQTQKVRVWSFEVAGEESVEVQAGRYDAWKTTLDTLDGEGGTATMWISKEQQPKVVRTEMTLPPAMGGGTAMSYLKSDHGAVR